MFAAAVLAVGEPVAGVVAESPAWWWWWWWWWWWFICWRIVL